jgi:hypothetical protein
MAFKRPAAMLLTAAVATATLSAFAAPALAGSEESQFISKHNATRSSRGIRTMAVKSDLTSVARRHSARMASKGTIWHNPNLANEVGGNWTVLGENVGMGPDVNDLYQAFMDSSPHRRNILDPDYNQFGVGVVISEGTIYVTIVFAKRGATSSTPTYRRPRSTNRTVTPRKPRVARPAATVPVRKPVVPKPALVATPRNVTLLVRLVGMDAVPAASVNGKALGIINFNLEEQLELLTA